MKISLIVTTYNWPEALRLSLESVKRQTRMPDEVIVADDGSGEETRKLVEEMRRGFPCPRLSIAGSRASSRTAAAFI